MEASQEPIGTRVSKLNSYVTGRNHKPDQLCDLVARESLLDVLQALYDECNVEAVRKYDRQIAQFVEKHKSAMLQLKQMRVNIADFDIKGVIGRGHFGEVHLVREKQTGDVYAMKTIRKADSLEKTSFNVERDIMASGHSPWLTGLQYAFQDAACLFFVMDYHPGGDLLGLLYRQGGTLPESAATFYVAELLLALEDLHSMGYVHRDVKPENVLLDRCGHVKLADFGSAARLNPQGVVEKGPPVGTPDYVAPEVLQSVEGRSPRKFGYGVSCDYWSLGVLAYELTVGKTPFHSQHTTGVYSRIMNYANNLKFPPDLSLTQAYVDLVKGLISDHKSRLNHDQIKTHPLFLDLDFETLRDRIPPYVPKINSVDDTSNFSDVADKKSAPSIDSFKKRTQFSGRNLPFVGFTYTHDAGTPSPDLHNRASSGKNEIIKHLKSELEETKRALLKNEDEQEMRLTLERKLIEKGQKLETIETVREKLEKELAASIAERAALKRTLDFERKDRSELERKALELIRSAKAKWTASEHTKTEKLRLEIAQQQEQIAQLTTTNSMLSEQLQRVLKFEDSHRESLETAEKLGRQSVVGLESRLEKITMENNAVIHNLQSKINDEITKRHLTEKKLDEARNDATKLVEKLRMREEECDNLMGKVNRCEHMVEELSRKVNEMEADMENSEHCQHQVLKLEQQIVEFRINISELEKKNYRLQAENDVNKDLKREIDHLKQIKIQNERQIADFDKKLTEAKEKVAALKQDLVNKENSAGGTQELREMRTKCWRTEKELSNCNLDKRSLERDFKESQKEIKQLKDEVSTLNGKLDEGKKIHESAILELSGLNESMSLELMRLKEVLKSMENKLMNEKEKYENEKVVMLELKEIIRSKDSTISDLNDQINALKNEKKNAESRCGSLEAEKSRIVDELNGVKARNQELQGELESAVNKLDAQILGHEALKDACRVIEEQVMEFERANLALRDEKAALVANTHQLVSDLAKANQEIQEAKRSTNEEKSLRLLAEAKAKRLDEDVESLQKECSSYKTQGMEFKQCSNQLFEDLRHTEEKLMDLEVLVKSYERQIDEMASEIKLLKEESSRYLTLVNEMKEANFRLKQQVQDLKNVKSDLVQKIDELERTLSAKVRFYQNREVKSEATIQQQIKLIDYLKSKIDESSHKKKTFADKLFGHSKKENVPPPLPLHQKDLAAQLQREKQKNKNMEEEIYRLRTELSLKEIGAVSDLVTNKVRRSHSDVESTQNKMAVQQMLQSPPAMAMSTKLRRSSSGLKRMHSFQRMYHCIPHRFEDKFCAKVQKCEHCQSKIMPGWNLKVCKECRVSAHAQCADSLGGSCGLPPGYLKRFQDTMKRLSLHGDSNGESNGDQYCILIDIEGWIKVLSNGNWEKRYARLSDARLEFYDAPLKERGRLVASFELRSSGCNGKVVLEPTESEIGLSVAERDQPFLLKVEVPREDAKCWPPKTVVFMALSLVDRDKWFTALQQIFNEHGDHYPMDTVIALPQDKDLQVNCLLELSGGIKLLGTDQGLYSYHADGSLVHIDGVTDVYHVTILNNAVLMIAGPNADLIWCDLNHLMDLTQCAPCTKPTLNYHIVKVNDLSHFHFLHAASERTARREMLCAAATAKHLVMLRYDLDRKAFVPLRIMDTAEGVSCALFTEHTLLVGADKFFEIDLSTLKAEEFMDASDANLAHVARCYKMGSFPVAVKRVAEDPREYLLCFNELSVFVDEYGRSSRGAQELKTSAVPVAVEFTKNHLYVVHFGGVEIIKLRSDGTCATVNVELKNVRHLGSSRAGIYVLHDGAVKLLDGRKVVEPDDLSLDSDSTGGSGGGDDDEAASDRFSFTSSIVQSLDGNLSNEDDSSATDEPHNGGGIKKVTFGRNVAHL